MRGIGTGRSPGRTGLRRAAGRLALGVAAIAVLAGASGCTASDAPSTTTSATTSADSEVIAPVVVDLADVDGTTVEVAVGNAIDLTGDDETFTEWTAEITDESIAEFVPGRDDGSAQFDPGIDALAEGTTEVTLENGATGDVVEFTVEVTAD